MRILAKLLIFPGLVFQLIASLFITYLDRIVIARWQRRVGPPWYQPVADFLKLLAKEDIVPVGTDRPMAEWLPIVSLASTLTATLYVPIGNESIASFQGDLMVVLFLLSVPTFAYFLAGWATPSVYGIVGGSRSLLQYFAYEIPFTMALLTPAILSGTWSILQLMDAQRGYRWHAFQAPVAFMISIVGLIGKLKRVPFDIPHARTEVGPGPLTDYSGRKMAFWKLGVLLQTFVGVNLIVALFLGGADRLWGPWGYAIYTLKALAFVFGLASIQALYARLRIDQMMSLSWRILVPLGLLQTLAAVWIGKGG